VIFSRVSESKNYTDSPCSSKTGICLEIPCFYNDDVWNADSQTLGKQALDDLEKSGMPVACRIEQVFKKSVRYAYPLYERNYGWNMTIINTFLEGITNLICLGVMDCFLHDNIHHDMDMAYTAVSCVQNDCSFDTGRWLGQLPRLKIRWLKIDNHSFSIQNASSNENLVSKNFGRPPRCFFDDFRMVGCYARGWCGRGGCFHYYL
jgi:hypothetical protein